MTSCGLQTGSVQEPPLQVSKWLRMQFLLEPRELELLFEELQDGQLYATGVVQPEQVLITHEAFLEQYQQYVQSLKMAERTLSPAMRQAFSAQLSMEADALRLIELPDGRQMVRPVEPVLQWQPHGFTVDSQNGRVHSVVFAQNMVPWGLQLSYPQLYLKVGQGVVQLNDRSNQPNTALFRGVQKWLRRHTLPTPLLINGEKHNLSIRVGKLALESGLAAQVLAASGLALELA